ncbi:MAG: phosphomannomutase/phosphoglucomutase [Rickettsiales bacterium]|jgi:phosphomannomutase|nr:phosphomannomutase/phosphoglucomutase [Rickettsiales bacterium]
MNHIFEKTILKQYDIRGVVDKEINSKDAYFVGKSYGTMLQNLNKKSCVVGYDARFTSKPYSEEVIKGLTECGIDIVNIGLVPTPMVYFAIHFLKKDAGLIITASHNPPEYNGFKMLTNEDPIWGDGVQELGKIAEKGEFFKSNKVGNVENTSIREDYFKFLLNMLNKNNKKKLKVCWDAGNGAVAAVIDDFVGRLPNENITICNTVDSTFPNHHPNPEIPENMKMLGEAVVKNKCDFGIGFDGDGDRIGIVDGEGYMLYGDQLLCIFARDYLKSNPGAKVMSEVSASLILYDDITKHGGVPVMWKPGHSIQKAKMKSDNIKLAGETSGHIFFGENHNYDDAMYAGIKLINILSNCNESLMDIRKAFPVTYSTNKINIKSNDIDKFTIPNAIAERIKKQGREICTVEGARVNKADGWWMCRNSSTSPQMTVRCEALSQKGLDECKREVKEQLNISGYDVNFE